MVAFAQAVVSLSCSPSPILRAVLQASLVNLALLRVHSRISCCLILNPGIHAMEQSHSRLNLNGVVWQQLRDLTVSKLRYSTKKTFSLFIKLLLI